MILTLWTFVSSRSATMLQLPKASDSVSSTKKCHVLPAKFSTLLAKNWKPKKEFQDNLRIRGSFHHSIGTTRLSINAELNKNVNFSEILGVFCWFFVEFLKFRWRGQNVDFLFWHQWTAFSLVATLVTRLKWQKAYATNGLSGGQVSNAPTLFLGLYLTKSISVI